MSARAVNREERGTSRVLRDILIIVLGTTAVVWFAATFLVASYYVPSASMETTLNIGDRLFAQKFNVGVKDLKRGDVVIFKDPHNWLEGESTDGYLVKRIIGLPGDTVSCCDALGKLQINGISVTEPYVKYGESPSDVNFTATVPKGQLWVMGDNRDESSDSRYHTDAPFVPISDVVAKVDYVYYPFSDHRGLGDYGYVFEGVPDRNIWG